VLPENEGQLVAYIHNNPVAAEVVPRARESTWTSHRAYMGLDVAPAWLHVDSGLLRAGLDDRAQFDAWIDATPGDAGYVELEGVRRLAQRRGAIEVATPTGGAVPVIPLVSRPCAYLRPDPRVVVRVTADVIGLGIEDLCSRRRNPAVQ